MWVCVSCACGRVQKSLFHPLHVSGHVGRGGGGGRRRPRRAQAGLRLRRPTCSSSKCDASHATCPRVDGSELKLYARRGRPRPCAQVCDSAPAQ
eukprot:4260591-Prymnesium_polylepis.1